MTRETGMTDLAELLDSWLEAAGPQDVRPDVVDEWITEARSARQRRGLTAALFGGGAWPLERGALAPRFGARVDVRPLMIVLVLLLIAAVAAAIAGGGVPRSTPVPTTSGASRVAFTTQDGDLYLVDPDGRNPVRVADGTPPAGFWSVSWSPDGSRLTYGDGETVSFADPDGVVAFSVADAGCCPTWSPDGSMVAGVLYKAGASRGSSPDRADDFPDGLEIVILDREGAVQARLPLLPGPVNFLGSGTHLYWAPDGRSITVKGAQWRGPNSGSGVLVPIDGGEWVPLRVAPAYGAASFSSPDGTRLVGELVVESGEQGPFVVAAADASQARSLVPAGGVPAGGTWYGALWSPDSNRVAATYGTFTGSTGSETLYVIDVAGGDVKALWTIATTEDQGFVIYPRDWDLVSDRVLFAAGGDLMSIGADGSDPRLLAEGGYNDAAFQPAGR